MDFIVLGLVFSLLLTLLQDLRFRKIHIFFPILIFVFSVLIFKKAGFNSMVYLINALFFIIVLAFLILYMTIKNKKIINPFTNYFGLGDLLFYLAVTPLFVTYNYILYFILSMVFSIALQFSFKKIMTHETIPLAGFSALLLLLIIAKDLLFSFNKITLL